VILPKAEYGGSEQTLRTFVGLTPILVPESRRLWICALRRFGWNLHARCGCWEKAGKSAFVLSGPRLRSYWQRFCNAGHGLRTRRCLLIAMGSLWGLLISDFSYAGTFRQPQKSCPRSPRRGYHRTPSGTIYPSGLCRVMESFCSLDSEIPDRFVQSPSKSRDIVLSLLQTLQEREKSFAESGPGHFPAYPGACKRRDL
jgi:hypothetical protein